MNDKGIKAAIRQRIELLREDSVFTVTDFSDIADSDSTRHVFKELADSGQIARAARGVYYKPRYSSLLGRQVPPDVDEVANAVARARGWTISPSGDHALNLLGLDTQVPAHYIFISTGPYLSLQVGSLDIRFKHAANKDLLGMSPITRLIVQALKALGRNLVDDKVISHLSRRLSDEDKAALMTETGRATAWVRQAIMRIAKEEVS